MVVLPTIIEEEEPISNVWQRGGRKFKTVNQSAKCDLKIMVRDHNAACVSISWHKLAA